MEEEYLGNFDILSLGTDLSSSMHAALQASEQGKKVLQLESSPLYGGNPMIDAPKGFIVDHFPLLCFAKGPLIEALRSSGAAEHIEFTSIDRIIFHYKGEALAVPFTREDVFSSTQLSLLEKRKLMRLFKEGEQEEERKEAVFFEYLTVALGLSERLALMIITSVCLYQGHPKTLSTSQGIFLCKRFVGSVGVYGPSPLFYPAYGAREVAQAYSRICAVKGGIQVLNAQQIEIDRNNLVHFTFDNNKFSASFDSLLGNGECEDDALSVSCQVGSSSSELQELHVHLSDDFPKFNLTLNSKSCCCPPDTSITYSWQFLGVEQTKTKRNVFN